MTYDPRRRSTLTRINFYTSWLTTRILYQNPDIQFSTLNGPSTFYFTSYASLAMRKYFAKELQKILKPFIYLSTAAVASYFDHRNRPLINCVNWIFRINQLLNRGPKWSMKNSEDLRPPSSIYSHSFKFLYEQTGYKNFVLKSGNSIFYAKWTFDSLLHASRIVGYEKIFRQRIVKNSEALYLSLNRRCRIIFRPSQSSAY